MVITAYYRDIAVTLLETLLPSLFNNCFVSLLAKKTSQIYYAKCNLACYSPKFIPAKVSLYSVIKKLRAYFFYYEDIISLLALI